MKNIAAIFMNKKEYLIGTAVFVLIIVLILLGIYPQSTGTQHLVWKSSFLGDSTGNDSLASKINILITNLHLVEPKRPVWKSLYLIDSLSALTRP